MPVRAVATGFRATATLTGASITAATAVSATLAKTGVGTGMKVAIIPLRAGAKALSGELSRETLGRNCWRGERRAWIEVRGLRSGGDDELGRVVLNAIQAHPGVGSASLNYPLSRVVVAIDDPDTSLRELCRIVDDAEKAERHRHPDQAADQLAQSPGSLPVRRRAARAVVHAGARLWLRHGIPRLSAPGSSDPPTTPPATA